MSMLGSVLHHLKEGKVAENPGIVVTAHPAGEDMAEASPVADDALQHNKEALVVDELLGALGWAKDGDMNAYGPHELGEAHPAEARMPTFGS